MKSGSYEWIPGSAKRDARFVPAKATAEDAATVKATYDDLARFLGEGSRRVDWAIGGGYDIAVEVVAEALAAADPEFSCVRFLSVVGGWAGSAKGDR